MIFYCRCCLGVTKEIEKVLGFEIRWIEDLLYFWRGHGNAFTRYVDLKFWIADDKIFYCLCFRSCLAQLQQRPICNFVKWVNTYYNEFLCSHCLRLASTELIDHYHNSGYFYFLHATPRYRLQAREQCREMYVELFDMFDWLGKIE